MSSPSLSSEQKEIVELLVSELEELSKENHDCLASGDTEAQKSLLSSLTIHLTHVANALELAGLSGLAFCATRLCQIFEQLAEPSQAIDKSVSESISNWGLYFLDYLSSIDKSSTEFEKQEAYVARLLGFLSQKSLPKYLDEDEIIEARELFHISELMVVTEDALPQQVTESMVSLTVGPDIKHELLQGLLIELPTQTKQFESSVNQFLDTHQFDALKQAQRVAHTIKGAANIVAIKGMANLTHFTEDLLETAAKNLDKPPEGFNDLLIMTSDCLASTAEYLNGQGPAPEDLMSVMQTLLSWLNKLKGVSDVDEHIQNHEDDFAPTERESANETTTPATPEPNKVDSVNLTSVKAIDQNDNTPADSRATDNERFINLPEKTAQELLRLSGEMQIANNQVTSQITNIESSIELAQRHHKQIRQMAAELDAMVQTQSALKSASMKYGDNEIDPLEMERFSELHTFSNRLQELTTDSSEAIIAMEQEIKSLSGLTLSQKQFNRDNQNLLLDMNLLPISQISARLQRCVRQTCRLTGKKAKLTLSGDDILVDNRVLSRITDPLMHVLRNAIDHGLEDEETRKANAKSIEGNISLTFTNNGDAIEIYCTDDGAGLDFSKIRENAINKGLLEKSADVDEETLSQLIFMPGFSTRKEATQTSGRGIGLDSVQSEIRAMKGNISISSKAGKGCELLINVPTSILTAHALLVACRDRTTTRTYGIATRGIQQIVYVLPDQLSGEAKSLFVTVDDEQIPVMSMSELLDLYAIEQETINAVLILERRDTSKIAVGVEKIITGQDLVIKPLNPFSYQPPGVIGATILGDGNVSPVIDMNDLPVVSLSQNERNQFQESRIRKILQEQASFVAPQAALIVDDSLSARRSLAQFVSDIGMEVYTAKDGFDAIHVMKEKKPSLMLVDLEMPRMNGLELTAHVRAQQEYHDIPVIMITSRSTQQHKEMAHNAGVTRYLTKPWSDDELLNCIKKEIA